MAAHRVLSSPSRVEILHVLQGADDPLCVEHVAVAVGLHVNTTREHLERLAAAGFLERRPEERTTRGRPRILYRVVDRDAGATLDQRLRSHLLSVLAEGYGRQVDAPDVVAEGIGRAWAAGLTSAASARGEVDDPADDGASGQLAALEMHLDDLGMRPEVELDPLQIHLHRCPFEDLARQRPDVVCSVHLGVARGVLAHHDGPVVAEALEPFVGPQHCILHLARRGTEPVASITGHGRPDGDGSGGDTA